MPSDNASPPFLLEWILEEHDVSAWMIPVTIRLVLSLKSDFPTTKRKREREKGEHVYSPCVVISSIEVKL